LFISCFFIILIIVQTINGLSNASSASNKKENQGIGEWWIMFSVPTASVISNVSEKCFQHSREFLTALKSRLPWAVKSKSIQASLFLLLINFDFFFAVYESSGRLVEDLIYIEGSDNVHHGSGLFDECLSVESDEVPFQGQYCTVFFGLKQTHPDESVSKNDAIVEKPNEHISNFQKPSVGFCLPSTCSASDLRSAVAQLVGSRVIKEKKFSVVAISGENYCYTQEKINASKATFDYLTLAVLYVYSNLNICFLLTPIFLINFLSRLVFCLLGIIVTTATIHHIFWTENSETLQSFPIQLLHCFSAKKNCRTLFSTEPDSKDSLSCVHGIRVLTIGWIVFMHVGSEFSIERMVYNKSTAVKVIMVSSHYHFDVFALTFYCFSGAEFLTVGSSGPRKWIVCGR